MTFKRISAAAALCAFVLAAPVVALAAGPEEERLLGSDRDDRQFADLLPFTRIVSASGKILGSLADSTAIAGVPPAAMLEALKALATTVDFARELRDGDSFHVRWEQQYSIDNTPLGTGRVLWAELQLPGRRVAAVHRFKPRIGPEVFYTANGQPTTSSPLRLPLDTIVVSSGFGLRVDPFDQPATRGRGMGPARVPAAPPLALGSNEAWQENSVTASGMLPYAQGFASRRGTSGGMAMHEGVDLVAPTGTPIHAAADGIVKGAEPKGRYGNWIEIEHANGVTTVYGHLSRFTHGMVPGARVAQSEIIGYVGTTGRTTGPHVHFELLIDGRPVNPMAHASARRAPLRGDELAAFRKIVARDRAERDREKAP